MSMYNVIAPNRSLSQGSSQPRGMPHTSEGDGVASDHVSVCDTSSQSTHYNHVSTDIQCTCMCILHMCMYTGDCVCMCIIHIHILLLHLHWECTRGSPG